jgi:predicted ATPase
LMKESIVRYRALGQELNVGPWLCGLAGCYLKAGRTEDALRCVGEASEVMECTGVGVMHAPLLWLRGELRFASTPIDLAAAEDDFRSAIDVARRQSNKFWQLRASTSLARLWRDQGKRTEAYDLLAPIYGWFTEGFDTPELTEAKALLDRLG